MTTMQSIGWQDFVKVMGSSHAILSKNGWFVSLDYTPPEIFFEAAPHYCVAMHTVDVPTGTFRSILKQSRLNEGEFRKL